MLAALGYGIMLKMRVPRVYGAAFVGVLCFTIICFTSLQMLIQRDEERLWKLSVDEKINNILIRDKVKVTNPYKVDVQNRDKVDVRNKDHVDVPNRDQVHVVDRDNIDRPKIANDGLKRVILLSHMKSGTTFVGSMFERNPNIFYLFEPEWTFYDITLNRYLPLEYLDGTVRDPIWVDTGDRGITELMTNFLTCNITGIDINSLRSRFNKHSQHLRPLDACTKHGHTNVDCVAKISRVCKSRKVQFAKTTRVRMDMVEKLLRWDPNLRVIHLLRDPRGVTLSRLSYAEVYASSAILTVGRVCKDMLHDVETVEKMEPGLRSRVLPVMYEDVAENPEKWLEKLYSFLEIPLPKIVKSHVKKITQSKKDVRKGFNLHRENSAQTANTWRKKMKWPLCQEIDRVCGRVYNKMGLVSVKSEQHLRDFDISLRKQNAQETYLYKLREDV